MELKQQKVHTSCQVCKRYLLAPPSSISGHDSYSGGYEQQIGKRGAMNSKGSKGGQLGHIFLKLILDILKLRAKKSQVFLMIS